MAGAGRAGAVADPSRHHRRAAYHQAVGYLTLGMVFLLFFLALLPSRRLWVAGTSLAWRAGYLVTLLVLGYASIEADSFARYLLPVLLVLYLVPFTSLPARWQQWRRRGPNATVIEGRSVRLDPDEPGPSP